MTIKDVMTLFEEKDLVKICAPMVRYSKLQFRTLVRQYNCDLCFSPMILGDSFCISTKARENEFKTNQLDTPLIVQFAANTIQNFVGAAHMISPYCNGVDLNCGCPQRWAKQQGLGCALLDKPDLIADLVKQCRNQILKPFTVSVKTRILSDVKKTVNICKQLEMAGVSFLTMHARTPSQLKGNIDKNALKTIRENICCPLIANGGFKTLEDCYKIQEETGCKGVMVANGILSNPTLFTGSNEVPLTCVQEWLDICYNSTLNLQDYNTLCKNKFLNINIPEKPQNLTFQCFHHHLVFMLEKILSKRKRKIFNNYQHFADVIKFLNDEYELLPKLYDIQSFKQTSVMNVNYENRNSVYDSFEKLYADNTKINNYYDYEKTQGKHFQSKIVDDFSVDLSTMYDEN